MEFNSSAVKIHDMQQCPFFCMRFSCRARCSQQSLRIPRPGSNWGEKCCPLLMNSLVQNWFLEKAKFSETSELCSTDETFPPSIVQSGITASSTDAKESKALWIVSGFLPILEREQGYKQGGMLSAWPVFLISVTKVISIVKRRKISDAFWNKHCSWVNGFIKLNKHPSRS